MAKQRPPSHNSALSSASAQAANHQPAGSVTQVQHSLQNYSGPIPPPSILKGFDDLVPGSANRLITMAEDEAVHRRHLESRALDANITTQKRQLDVGEQQSKAAFRSDLFAQVLGACITVFAMVAAIWASLRGQIAVAVILAAIPTAALIQSFFAKRSVDKTGKDVAKP